MEKPDPTGEIFGFLRCMGRGERVKKKTGVRNTRGIQLWRMRCICGNEIQLRRGWFDSGKQISCGCVRGTPLGKPPKKPTDITGQRFGELTAVSLTGKKKNRKPTWFLMCDCGEVRELSLSAIRYKQRKGYRLNCGTHEWGFKYPAMPSPMPHETAELIEKYLYFCETSKFRCIKQHVQDEKRERLERSCWIITYRRQKGENITSSYEQNFVKKYLRYAAIAAHLKDSGIISTYNRTGSVMTKQQLPTYPSIKKTVGIKTLPKSIKFIRR